MLRRMDKESRKQGLGGITRRGPPGDTSSPHACRPCPRGMMMMRCDATAPSHGSRTALPRRPELAALPAPDRDGEA